MYKVVLILDKFFLKYEKEEGGGGGLGGMVRGGSIESPQEKLTSKSPALLELSYYPRCTEPIRLCDSVANPLSLV